MAPAASIPSSSIAFSVASGISPFSKLLVIAKIFRPLKVENKPTVSVLKSIAYPPKSFVPGLNPDCLKESFSGSELHLSTAATNFSPNGVPELHAMATSEVVGKPSKDKWFRVYNYEIENIKTYS